MRNPPASPSPKVATTESLIVRRHQAEDAVTTPTKAPPATAGGAFLTSEASASTMTASSAYSVTANTAHGWQTALMTYSRRAVLIVSLVATIGLTLLLGVTDPARP